MLDMKTINQCLEVYEQGLIHKMEAEGRKVSIQKDLKMPVKRYFCLLVPEMTTPDIIVNLSNLFKEDSNFLYLATELNDTLYFRDKLIPLVQADGSINCFERYYWSE